MNLSASPLRSNVELKARIARRDDAVETALRLGARDMGEEEQTDTYFVTGNERLKLRESSSGAHWLIRYSRPDVQDVRKSQYRLMPLQDPGSFKAILTRQWGVKAVVRKKRRLFLWNERVRIHLDLVEGLGEFLEFEAVLDPAHPEYDEAAATLEVGRLAHDFRLDPADYVPSSYSTLVMEITRLPSGT